MLITHVHDLKMTTRFEQAASELAFAIGLLSQLVTSQLGIVQVAIDTQMLNASVAREQGNIRSVLKYGRSAYW